MEAQHTDTVPTMDDLEDSLRDALSEVYILREALKGAIIGDKIIADQLAASDGGITLWAHKQATHNATCNRLSLERSLADFPWRGPGIAVVKAAGQ